MRRKSVWCKKPTGASCNSIRARTFHCRLWFASGVGPLLPDLESLKEIAKALELKESDRLLYVAMTRAEDELYITGIGRKKGEPLKDSWWPKVIERLGSPQRFGAEDVILPPASASHAAQPFVPPHWLTETPSPETRPNFIGINAAVLAGASMMPPRPSAVAPATACCKIWVICLKRNAPVLPLNGPPNWAFKKLKPKSWWRLWGRARISALFWARQPR